ncbi:MAG TPA: hypothetical protein VGG42_17065 [Acidobacteriaceae bacterium]|jgi:hypothetical protein
MRQNLLTLVLLLIAANGAAAIWIFLIYPGASIPSPLWIFFVLEGVGFAIFIMLLPFIGGWLFTVFTIGAGVSVGNVLSDRISRQECTRGQLSLERHDAGRELGRGRPQFFDLRPIEHQGNPVLLPPSREASPCQGCGHYLRATDRFCPGCGVAR